MRVIHTLRSGLLALLALVALSSGDVMASTTWVETFSATCPNGSTTDLSVTCAHEGEVIRLRVTCPGSAPFIAVYECEAPDGYKPEAVTPLTPTSPSSRWIDMGLSLSGGGFTVSNCPDGGHLELQLAVGLRFGGDWYLRLQAGVGWGRVNEDLASVAEFAGVQWRVSPLVRLAIGPRHRILFGGQGDELNALFGELQLQLVLSQAVSVVLFGGAGGAWHPTTTQASGLFAAGTPRPTQTELATDTAFQGGASVEVSF